MANKLDWLVTELCNVSVSALIKAIYRYREWRSLSPKPCNFSDLHLFPDLHIFFSVKTTSTRTIRSSFIIKKPPGAVRNELTAIPFNHMYAIPLVIKVHLHIYRWVTAVVPKLFWTRNPLVYCKNPNFTLHFQLALRTLIKVSSTIAKMLALHGWLGKDCLKTKYFTVLTKSFIVLTVYFMRWMKLFNFCILSSSDCDLHVTQLNMEIMGSVHPILEFVFWCNQKLKNQMRIQLFSF